MYVSPSCYIVQRFFKHYVSDDDVRNIETCLLDPLVINDKYIFGLA